MKRVITFYTLLTLFMFGIISCYNKTNKNETKKKVNKYISQEIQLPQDSIILLQNNKVLPIEKFNFSTSKNKIVTRIDGQCHICVYELDQWKQELMKKFRDQKVQFIFYLYTDNFKLFRRKYYHRISGTYPILIDTTNAFVSDNNLPKIDKRFHSFLLNKNNEVILIGNPIMNSQIKDLYLEEIDKRLD